MSRGGKRKGAGRPRGEPKLTMSFEIRQRTAKAFRKAVPPYKRSEFVDHAIQKGLEGIPEGRRQMG